MAEDVPGQQGRQVGVDALQQRETAAEDEDVGVEDIDDGREAAGEAVFEAVEGREAA